MDSVKSISSFKLSLILCILRAVANIPFAVISYCLIFYLIYILKLDLSIATTLVGSVVSLNALLYFISGFIGGRYISNRHLFILGISLQILSAIFLAFGSPTLLSFSLALFVGGNGLSSTCINNIISYSFRNNAAERESAFFWSYSGMNLGFFIGLLLAGIFMLEHNYRALFICSGISSIVTAVIFVFYWKAFQENINIGLTSFKSYSIAYFTILSSLCCLGLMLYHPVISNIINFSLSIIIFISSLIIMSFLCKEYLANIVSFYFLALVTFVFWIIFQIGPMGLMLFIAQDVKLSIEGLQIAPPWFQNINTISIAIGGPIFAYIIKFLRARGLELTEYTLFTYAMLCIGLSFLILPIGIKSANLGLVAPGWVIATLVLQSIGELFIAPVGFALVGKLIPAAYQNRLMGIWMMVFGISAVGSAYFSKLMTQHSALSNTLQFSHWFTILGTCAVCLAIAVYTFSLFISPKTKLIAN